MSWSELERLVSDAEANAKLRDTLSSCRSRQQLLQAARHLGYRVTRTDLQNAWVEHQRDQDALAADAQAR